MRQDIATDVALAALDKLDVGLHALGRKGSSEKVRNVGVRVKTAERDELPD